MHIIIFIRLLCKNFVNIVVFSIYLFYNKYNAKMDFIGYLYYNQVVFQIQLGIIELK